MKTEYFKMYEYLTPLLVTGRITSEEMAKILAVVKLLELRVNVLEKTAHDLYAELKREDLAQDTYENVTINGEGEE